MAIPIKVLSFRKNYEQEDKEWAYYTAVVDLRSVPEALEQWRKVNLRDPNVKGDIFNAITRTIKSDSKSFLRKNRGITLLAESVELNKSNDQIVLQLIDDKLHGIVDGGHTYTAIMDARDETTDGYVAFHILTGITDLREVVDIVDARNRSRSAQSQSLDNLEGVYDPIKEVLRGYPYSDLISYSEYDTDDNGKRKPISIREILSYVYCLNPEDHTEVDDHPVAAYSSKGVVVNYFSPPAKGEEKAMTTKNKGFQDDVIAKSAPILPSILSFVDFLYKEIPSAYNGKDEGRFGALSTLGVQSKAVQLYFGGESATHSYPDAFLYPILAAFRKKLIVSEGRWEWVEAPEVIWARSKESVGRRLRQIVDRETSVNKLGKTSLNWTFLSDAIN